MISIATSPRRSARAKSRRSSPIAIRASRSTRSFAAVAGCYQGHDGLRKFFRDYEDVWGEEIWIETEAYFDLGEHTLLFVVVRGHGRHSGLEVVMASAHMAKWRDGLLVYFKAYADREDALSDLGVSEDSLEPIDP